MLDDILTVVFSGILSLIVCWINNRYVVKIKLLDILEKRENDTKTAERDRQEQVRSALSTYLSATGKYIASPDEETFKGWCEIKDAIYLYAPANTHKRLDELNEKLLNYETPDWARFCNRQMIANALLTAIGKEFAAFMNIDQ